MFLPKINLTQFQHLSGTIQEKFQNLTQTELFSVYQALSGTPLNSYERKKIELFGENFNFPTAAEVEVPQNFCLKTCFNTLTAENYKVNQTTIQEVTSLSSTSITGVNIEPDIRLVKNIILLSEFGKKLTVEEINNDPIKTAQKVLTFAVNLLK